MRLAREALQTGGAATTILNAANEQAVQSFLNEEIGFLDIVRVVGETLGKAANGPLKTLDDGHTADTTAPDTAKGLISPMSSRH